MTLPLFNERGMLALMEILRDYNYAEADGTRTANYVMDLLTDTFGDGIIARYTTDCSRCKRGTSCPYPHIAE